MDSIREQVVAAFATKISAERARTLDGECDLPARALWDITEDKEKTQYGQVRCSLEINVGYMAKRDGRNASVQGNALLAELINDAISGDRTLGGLVESIAEAESTINYPQEGQSEIAVLVSFQVVYLHAIGSPYEQ